LATPDPGATASDNIDGDITGSIVVAGGAVNTAAVGAYVVTYDVNDSAGNPALEVTRIVNVTGEVVGNIYPIAYAGADLIVLGQEPVVIAGSGTDDDGTIVSYNWNQTLGQSVIINGETSVLSFEAPLVIGPALLRFELTVTDDQGAIASDYVDVSVTDKGSRQIVSAIGMQAIGYPEDYIYYSVDTPAIGRNGHVAFFGVADTSIRATNNASNGLWGGMADNLKLVLQEGGAVDGLPFNIQFQGGAVNSPPVVTKSGYIGFFSELMGAVNTNTNSAIMAQVGESITTVVRVGVSAPGLPPTSAISSLSNFSFTDAGMLISGTVDFANQALWYWDFNTIKLIAVTDFSDRYSIPEETLSFNTDCSYSSVSADKNIGYSFGGGGISDQGHVVFSALFSDNDCLAAISILGWKDGNLYKISDTSDVVENVVDGAFSSMSMLDMNDGGDVLIGTSVSQPGHYNRYASWLIPSGELPKLVAMDGELSPDDYAREILALFSSTFMMSNSQKVYGLTQNLLGGVSLGRSILFGLPRNSQPYEALSDVGASQLELVINYFDVPPGYSSESIIGFDVDAPMSVNNVGDMVFGAEIYDADEDSTHRSIWSKRDDGELVELVKTGQMVRVNGREQTLTRIFFQGGSTSQGSSAQYDDSGRLFIRSQLSETFQANILVTPE